KDKTKKELVDDYNMKQASPINKEWDEQVDFFEDYVEKNGVDKIKVNADGKAENDDVKSGCTISVDGFIAAIKDGEKNAK
ncbi:MAG: FMN-binding protein, partial [Longicatena sp.]